MTTNDVLNNVHLKEISNLMSNWSDDEISVATKSIKSANLLEEIEVREDFVSRKLRDAQYVLDKAEKAHSLLDKEKVLKELRDVLGIKENNNADY